MSFVLFFCFVFLLCSLCSLFRFVHGFQVSPDLLHVEYKHLPLCIRRCFRIRRASRQRRRSCCIHILVLYTAKRSLTSSRKSMRRSASKKNVSLWRSNWYSAPTSSMGRFLCFAFVLQTSSAASSSKVFWGTQVELLCALRYGACACEICCLHCGLRAGSLASHASKSSFDQIATAFQDPLAAAAVAAAAVVLLYSCCCWLCCCCCCWWVGGLVVVVGAAAAALQSAWPSWIAALLIGVTLVILATAIVIERHAKATA